MLSPVFFMRLLAAIVFLRFATAAAVPPLLNHQIEELTRHDDGEQLLNRRQNTNSSGFTVVTGIQGTSPQPRLEIRELQKNADQWNIYLLGMNRFMRTNESEKLSYYQIAGELTHTVLSHNVHMTDHSQASTVGRTLHGTASSQRPVSTLQDTVSTSLSSSSRGTAPTWRYTKLVSLQTITVPDFR